MNMQTTKIDKQMNSRQPLIALFLNVIRVLFYVLSVSNVTIDTWCSSIACFSFITYITRSSWFTYITCLSKTQFAFSITNTFNTILQWIWAYLWYHVSQSVQAIPSLLFDLLITTKICFNNWKLQINKSVYLFLHMVLVLHLFPVLQVLPYHHIRCLLLNLYWFSTSVTFT